MKKRVNVIVSLAMICVLCSIIILPACARASLYFEEYRVMASAKGSGKVLISIDVVASRNLSEIGASSVVIYEKQNDGRNKIVATYGKMTEKDNVMAYKTVTYQGTAGKSYYARVTLYGRDAKGNESLVVTSNVVKAS